MHEGYSKFFLAVFVFLDHSALWTVFPNYINIILRFCQWILSGYSNSLHREGGAVLISFLLERLEGILLAIIPCLLLLSFRLSNNQLWRVTCHGNVPLLLSFAWPLRIQHWDSCTSWWALLTVSSNRKQSDHASTSQTPNTWIHTQTCSSSSSPSSPGGVAEMYGSQWFEAIYVIQYLVSCQRASDTFLRVAFSVSCMETVAPVDGLCLQSVQKKTLWSCVNVANTKYLNTHTDMLILIITFWYLGGGPNVLVVLISSHV